MSRIRLQSVAEKPGLHVPVLSPSKLCNPLKPRPRPPRPSLSYFYRNGRSEGAICAALQSGLGTGRSTKMKTIGLDGHGYENLIFAV